MDENWTGAKVLEVAKAQQHNLEGKANFHGVCEQLRGVARAVIDQAMRSTTDPEKRHMIHRAAASFLMEDKIMIWL